MKVGFIGIGRMGDPMARRLLAAGHALAVYNRTPEKARALAAAGAHVALPVGSHTGEALFPQPKVNLVRTPRGIL